LVLAGLLPARLRVANGRRVVPRRVEGVAEHRMAGPFGLMVPAAVRREQVEPDLAMAVPVDRVEVQAASCLSSSRSSCRRLLLPMP
jgi:hypothetical protein